MIELGAIESKVVLSGYEYWLAKKESLGGDLVPARSDLDPLTEVPRLIPRMMLKDVRRAPLDFRYRLIGTALRTHMAQDWTGMWLSEIPFQSAGSMVWNNNLRVMESAEPLLARPPYVGPHKDFLYIESIILPLASDRRQVDMLMFFVDFIGRKAPAR
ncbi:PAS domain-containing protein [Dongia sp.]|uniref:PAS domain-containing protein n=1 Tax=Dongia sp. TaxID=1977262 RepID=UPI0035AF5500